MNNQKNKILTIIIISLTIVMGFGITYSYFNSSADGTEDQNIAKFVFNTESLDELSLSLVDMHPGDIEEFAFSVSNDNSGTLTEVTLEYQLTIKTYHYAPLKITFYEVDGETETLALTCDETYARDDNNMLVCTSSIYELDYIATTLDDYKIKVEFGSDYDQSEYADLVDFINIEINSWQKIAE